MVPLKANGRLVEIGKGHGRIGIAADIEGFIRREVQRNGGRHLPLSHHCAIHLQGDVHRAADFGDQLRFDLDFTLPVGSLPLAWIFVRKTSNWLYS